MSEREIIVRCLLPVESITTVNREVEVAVTETTCDVCRVVAADRPISAREDPREGTRASRMRSPDQWNHSFKVSGGRKDLCPSCSERAWSLVSSERADLSRDWFCTKCEQTFDPLPDGGIPREAFEAHKAVCPGFPPAQPIPKLGSAS